MSDHVLANLTSTSCGDTRLEPLELVRSDDAPLNAVGVGSIPDQTIAEDFTRRFDMEALVIPTSAFDTARLIVWKQQRQSFFDGAVIESMV